LKALAAIQIEALPLIEDRMEREHKELIPPQFIPALQKSGGGVILREWQFLGPLNDPIRESRLAAGRLSFDDPLVDNAGKKHRWLPVTGNPLSGQVNVRECLSYQPASTNSTVYLATRFARPEEQEMELTVVCPDASRLALWLNGTRLSTFGESSHRFHKTAVATKRGDNVLLAQIQNPLSVSQFGVSLALARPRTVLTRDVQLPREAYADFALHNTGNVDRGRKWFREPSGAGCIRCHRVNGEGGTTGPDLSGIGSKYNREHLIEAILYPSKQILIGYRQTLITTTDGETLDGLIQREDDQAMVLVDSSGQEHTIKTSQVAQRKLSAVSPMPEGLYAYWSRRDFADVVEFLGRLKASPQVNLK